MSFKKSILRLVALLLVLVGLITVPACSTGGEQVLVRETMIASLEAMKDPTYFAANCLDEETLHALVDYGIDPVEFASKVLADMSYELGEPDVSGNKATATLTLSTRNVHAAMESAANRFLALTFDEQQEIYEHPEAQTSGELDQAATDTDEAETQATSDEKNSSEELKLIRGQQALLNELIGYFYDELDASAENLTTAEIELVCTKDADGNWQLALGNNAALIDAILA